MHKTYKSKETTIFIFNTIINIYFNINLSIYHFEAICLNFLLKVLLIMSETSYNCKIISFLHVVKNRISFIVFIATSRIHEQTDALNRKEGTVFQLGLECLTCRNFCKLILVLRNSLPEVAVLRFP